MAQCCNYVKKKFFFFFKLWKSPCLVVRIIDSSYFICALYRIHPSDVDHMVCVTGGQSARQRGIEV